MNYNQWYKAEIVGDQSQGQVDYTRCKAKRERLTTNIIRRQSDAADNNSKAKAE